MSYFKLITVGMVLVLLGIGAAIFTNGQINPATALEKNRIAEIIKAQQNGQIDDPIVAAREELINNPNSPTFGPSDARVTVVEFFDYRCPYCKRMVAAIDSLMAENPNLRVVFKEFPILAQDSLEASKAALAAHRQGKYLPFHRVMMAHSGAYTQEAIENMAQEAGLNIDQLRMDMADPAIIEQLRDNHRLAQKLKIEGTPAFVIGDQLVPGAVPIGELRRIISEQGKSGS